MGLSGRYVALSGFYVVWRFFGLGPEDAMTRVLDRARAFCHLGWVLTRGVKMSRGLCNNKLTQ